MTSHCEQYLENNIMYPWWYLSVEKRRSKMWARNLYSFIIASLVAQRLKHLPAMWETRVQSLGQEDPLEKEMETHSSTPAWRIPWREEPGAYSPQGHKELDMTERLHFHFHHRNVRFITEMECDHSKHKGRAIKLLRATQFLKCFMYMKGYSYWKVSCPIR